MLKLISEKYTIHYASKIQPNQLASSNSSTIFEPEGTLLALGFGSIIAGDKFPRSFIQELIARNFGVVYFCDELPSNILIHPSIVYVVSEWAWFNPTAFLDYHKFCLAFNSGKSTLEITNKFTKLNDFNCKRVDPVFDSLANVDAILSELQPILHVESTEVAQKTLLFDTVSYCADRGLGDILMTTIPLKYLAENGWKIDYIVRKAGAELLKNNPYINKIYSTSHELCSMQHEKLNALPKIKDYLWYFTLATNLEDYRITRNLNCRIDSICDLLRVDVKKIEDFTPVMQLTEEEIEFGRQYIDPSKINLALGLMSNGSENRSYPREYWDELLNKLNRLGRYNVIVMDQAPLKLLERPNVKNLTGKLNIRQWASVVYNCDEIASMDTGIYWIGLAFKKPCVVMFTTINPDIRVSHHKNLVRSLYPPLKCKPCYDRQMVKDVAAWKECAAIVRKGNPPPCTKVLTPDLLIKEIKAFSIKRKKNG
jgi:ADP-heptose:LPS heptosyltransferase